METLLVSIFSFVSTNIDDVFILMVLFAQAKNTKDAIHIFLG